MQERYSRNIPALTEEECALLRTKKVLVVGCGGLGGYLIELLARLGIGSIRAVDGDVFEQSNLNRQLLSEVPLLGCSKAQAAADRVARVNPEVRVEALHCFLTEENALSLMEGCDAVLDGLDNIESRRILARACTEAGIPLVFGAIQGWILQAGIAMPGDHLMDILYPQGTVIRDKSALSFTPAFCAAMQVSMFTRMLCGRKIKTGTVYYVDMLNHEFETISLF